MTYRQKSTAFGLIAVFLLAPILPGCSDSARSVTADPGKIKAAIAKRRADSGEPPRVKAAAKRGG